VPFSRHEVCQDGKVTHSLRHVVPSVTHNLRTVDEMCDTNVTHVHLTISSSQVVTPWKNF